MGQKEERGGEEGKSLVVYPCRDIGVQNLDDQLTCKTPHVRAHPALLQCTRACAQCGE